MSKKELTIIKINDMIISLNKDKRIVILSWHVSK